MAKFSPLLGPLRGVIGALVFTHNKGGDIVKLRQAPTNPQSARQQQVRQTLASLAAAWSELTDSDRSLWAAYAEDRPRTDPLGNSYTMTGLQAFCSLNCVLVDAGGTQIDVPPTLGIQSPGGPPGTPGVSFTDEDTISVIISPAPPTGGRAVVWWNGVVGDGQDPSFVQAKLVGYSAVDPSGATAFELPYAVQDGATCKFYLGHIDAYGQRSQVQQVRTTYTAA